MFETTALWAIDAVGESLLKTLAGLLAAERQQAAKYEFSEVECSELSQMNRWRIALGQQPTFALGASAGPAIDAERNGLPITIRDNIAIIPVRGIMLKSYPWPSNYVTSTQHVRAAVRAARMDETIDHIVVLSDTPGGDVRGMHELTDEIANAAQDKNVIVQIEGTLASAGYHIAAPANAIYASHRMNTIGSIGVRTVLWDTTRMYQNAGIDVHKIDTGEHKSTGLDGVPVTEEQKAEVQRVVDQLYAEFLAVIIKGRGIAEADLKPLADGRSWFAYEAEGYGLIDAIQPLETTLANLKTRQPPAGRLTRAQADKLFAAFD